MRLLSFFDNGRPGLGLLVDNGMVVDITSAVGSSMLALIEDFDTVRDLIIDAAARRQPVLSLADICVRAPIPMPRRNIFCVGKNYSQHATEFARSGFDNGGIDGSEVPDYPIIFSKLSTAVVGPGTAIEASLDPLASVDYEGELAVIVAGRGRVAEGDDPMARVFGYSIINDVTSRELQKRHMQWVLGKGIDTFAPMGPVIVTGDELGDLTGLGIKTWVNGELRQSARLGDLIFDVPTLLRTIGRSITLEPGDIIATGTPAGVGIGFDPPRYLVAGDIVRISIENIGTLENVVG